ncbi:MAG: MATE family efflux transporter [Geminicoccaceae bacterium]|nr:MATE family efflux transporter [Geminicoccaceae bacterium]
MPPLGRSFRLALPLILSNLTVPLMGMVDTAVVGRIPGAHNLAAVALGAAVMNLVVWGFGFLRTATGGLAAQAFGAGDARTLKAILLRSGLVAVAATAFVFLLAPFAFPASAALFAAEGELRATLHAYLVVRILGTPFILGGQVLTGWFLGRQETGVPLLVMLTANLLNAALDVVLVLGLGYGVAGAAAATVAGDAAGLAVALLVLRRRWPTLRAASPALREVAAKDPLLRLLALGRDIFLRTMALQGAFLAFAALAAREGALVVAANAVLLNFFTLQAHGLDGFADAAEATAGRAVGGGRLSDLHDAVKAAFVNAGLLAALLSLSFWAFGEAIVALLTTLPEVRAEAGRYLGFVALLPPLSVAAFVWDGVFFGATRGREIRNAMGLAFAAFLPLAFLLRPFGNAGLWTALLAFLVLRGFLLTFLYRRAGWGAGFMPEKTAAATATTP